MLCRFDVWNRLWHAAYWWFEAMVAVWLIFTSMLFVIEATDHAPPVARAI
jgi:hypothetical protein